MTILAVKKAAAKLWVTPQQKGKSLQDYVDMYGSKLEWVRSRMRLASPDDELSINNEGIPSHGHLQQDPAQQHTDEQEHTDTAEVTLPSGIALSDYPITHEEIEDTGDTQAATSHQSNEQEGSRPWRRTRQWQDNKIKLDIFHSKQRLKTTVKKTHGCYNYFCELLTDAFFIVSEADWKHEESKMMEATQKAKPSVPVSEIAKNVRKVMTQKRRMFEKACRRVVPDPETLEHRLKSVVTIFANVEDAKTGEKFFSQRSWKAYQSLIRHVRMGCLSDKPGVNYYYDVQGQLRCICGTNALEGYHFHLRRIIQQFHSSPELCIKILMTFNHRWNHDRLVDRNLVSCDYQSFYHHFLLEEIQEITYNVFDEPVLDDWVSSKDFTDTGEKFYIPPGFTDGDITDTTDLESSAGDSGLSAAQQWSAMQESVVTPYQSVSGKFECELFRDNVEKYRRNQSSTTMATQTQNMRHANIPYDLVQFASWWNSQVDDNEILELCKKKPIFRKTSAMLVDHLRKHERFLNEVSTLNQNGTLGIQSVRDQAHATLARMRNQGRHHQHFQPAAVSQPQIITRLLDPTRKENRLPVGVVPLQLSGTQNEIVQELARGYHHVQRHHHVNPSKPHVKPKQRLRGVQICRRCGLERHGRLHDRSAPRNTRAYCLVPDDQRAAGHIVSLGYNIGDA